VPKALGLSTEEWVRERLGGYARLEIEPRREAVMELTADGFSKAEIAGVLGVGKRTIGRDRLGPPVADPLDDPAYLRRVALKSGVAAAEDFEPYFTANVIAIRGAEELGPARSASCGPSR
jgi:hypothetical protein